MWRSKLCARYRTVPGATAAALLTTALLNGCEAGPTGPSAEQSPPAIQSAEVPGAIKVMTWNVYQGAPLDPLFEPGLTPFEVIQRATAIWQQILATDFPSRAEAIADQIAEAQPDVVGLQEVAQFFTDPDGDGPLTQADVPVLDYLEILLDALEARGAEYVVGAFNANADAEVPIIVSVAPLDLDDIRLVDRDVILVRSDISWSNPQSSNFIARIPISLGGFSLDILRGWSAIDVTAAGTAFRFVNTHLETFVPAVQVAQAQELLAVLAAETRPVAMVGDFNSEADGSTTPTYGLVVETGGFRDAWPPQGQGFTCCHDPDLLNLRADLDQRIDFVFLRGDFGFGPPGFLGAVQGSLIGDKPSDRTPSGLYPSDHTGIATTIRSFLGLAQQG